MMIERVRESDFAGKKATKHEGEDLGVALDDEEWDMRRCMIRES